MTYPRQFFGSISSICLVLLPLLLTQTTIEFATVGNVTNCEEFLNGTTTLNITKLLNIDWNIFYLWNPDPEVQSHNVKFSLPTKMLVDRFRVELDDLKPEVNWDQAAMFMETSVGFSALYIKTNKSGLFRIIPNTAFHSESHTPLMFGVKLIEPEQYLGIMNCVHNLCNAMAPIDKMPKPNEIEQAAAKILFYNQYGNSYLNVTKDESSIVWDKPPSVVDDVEEDEQLEIDNYMPLKL